MEIRQNAAPGNRIITVKFDELCALLNFATCSIPDFPFGAFGGRVNADTVYDDALTGYNSLIRAGLFRINGDGYPEINPLTRLDDLVWTITALRTNTRVILLEMRRNKNHARFVIVKSPSNCAVIASRGRGWHIVGIDEFGDIGRTVVKMLNQNIREAVEKHEPINITMKWLTPKGRSIMGTEITRTSSDDHFHEKMPENARLAGTVMRWPHTYTVTSLWDRIEELVNLNV